MTTRRLPRRLSFPAALLLLAGAPSNTSDDRPRAGAIGVVGAFVVTAPGGASSLPPSSRTDIAGFSGDCHCEGHSRTWTLTALLASSSSSSSGGRDGDNATSIPASARTTVLDKEMADGDSRETATNNIDKDAASSSSKPSSSIDTKNKDKESKKDDGTFNKGGLMYTADLDFITTASTTYDDEDFVAVGEKEEVIEKDEALKLLSSEVGVRRIVPPSYSPEIPLDLVLERALDTIEDVATHMKRVPYKWGIAPTFHRTVDGFDARETVVVLGSGWAAHAFMKVADTSKLRIIAVSPTNHFVFTPMLASAAVGTVEYRSMTEAVRSANPMIDNYIEGKAVDVDVINKKVTVKLNPLVDCTDAERADPPEIEVPYDKLVVSVGARVATAKVPGASRCLRLKTCDDARNVRTAVGECFEYASRPDVSSAAATTDPDAANERKRRVTFLIVGGGPTGVELAGELSDFAADVTRPRLGAFSKLADDVQVVLAHGGSEVLPQFDPELRREAGESLRRRGVDLRLNAYVTNVGENNVTLSTKVVDPVTGEVSKTGERIEEVLPVGLTVWCAGTAPVPFVTRLLEQLPPEAESVGGRVKVDGWLRPPMPSDDLRGSIYVLGDAADFDAASSTSSYSSPSSSSVSPSSKSARGSRASSSSSLPQTAQVAGQQGAYAARLLSRGYDLSAEKPVLSTAKAVAEAVAAAFAAANGTSVDGGALQQLDSRTIDDEAAIRNWLRLRGLETSPEFRFFNLGLLAYLGGGEALSQVQVGDVSVFKWAGSVAFVLWRSVYLVKQVATKNRVLVTFDWIKSALFGRDVTRF